MPKNTLLYILLLVTFSTQTRIPTFIPEELLHPNRTKPHDCDMLGFHLEPEQEALKKKMRDLCKTAVFFIEQANQYAQEGKKNLATKNYTRALEAFESARKITDPADLRDGIGYELFKEVDQCSNKIPLDQEQIAALTIKIRMLNNEILKNPVTPELQIQLEYIMQKHGFREVEQHLSTLTAGQHFKRISSIAGPYLITEIGVKRLLKTPTHEDLPYIGLTKGELGMALVPPTIAVIKDYLSNEGAKWWYNLPDPSELAFSKEDLDRFGKAFEEMYNTHKAKTEDGKD